MANSYKIFAELDEVKSSYETKSLEKIPGLKRSQYQVVKMCEFYSDSKYMGANLGNVLGGDGRPVPFFNIVNFRVALAKTATDLDIKDIQIIADHQNYQTQSMLLNRESYEWMKEVEFSKVLNRMGSVRPKYGGYLVKKVYRGGQLYIEVVEWTNVMTNQKNIMLGPIVEKHNMSPVELQAKMKSWDNVKEVLTAFRKIKATNRPPTIDIFEYTGPLPDSILNNAEDKEGTPDDDFTYSLQHYFIASVDGKKFLMYSESLSGEMSDYYEYLAWEENGYGLGRGVIEDSEEAQVWTNDAVINESIAMALAGRVGIKTNSKKVGNNILNHDHGKIYELEDGKDMQSFNLAPSALGHYQTQISKWNEQANNVSGSYNAVTGEQPPSGTPYSQTALLNQVATKPFDYKREEWGIHLTRIFENWVIPHLIKKLYKSHVLVSDFSDTELELLDASFANYNANRDIVRAALKGKIVSPIQQDQLTAAYKRHIQGSGKKRFIPIPEGYFDDIECKVTVLTTGEQKNKAVILQSLSEIMKTVIGSFNPNTGEFGVLKDPTLSKIFNQIVELSGSGISPISIGKGATPTAKAPAPSSAPTAPVTGTSAAPSGALAPAGMKM